MNDGVVVITLMNIVETILVQLTGLDAFLWVSTSDQSTADVQRSSSDTDSPA